MTAVRTSLNAWGIEYEHDDECEADFVSGAGAWTPCGCADRLTEHEMRAALSMDSRTDRG